MSGSQLIASLSLPSYRFLNHILAGSDDKCLNRRNALSSPKSTVLNNVECLVSHSSNWLPHCSIVLLCCLSIVLFIGYGLDSMFPNRVIMLGLRSFLLPLPPSSLLFSSILPLSSFLSIPPSPSSILHESRIEPPIPFHLRMYFRTLVVLLLISGFTSQFDLSACARLHAPCHWAYTLPA